jgi:hypothetical protein
VTTPINPTLTTATPQPESRWCDDCGTYVPQYQTPSGEWLCGQGHNMTAACARDFELSAKVGDAARFTAWALRDMTPDERRRWWPLFVESVREAVPGLPETDGRSEF